MNTALKLFCMTHHVPVRISTEPAIHFYRTVARRHGYRLDRSLGGRFCFA